MTHKRKTLFCAGGFLFCTVLFGTYMTRSRRPNAEPVITAAEIAPSLKDGDIICRMGDRFWSVHFRNLSPADKQFSHLGIVRVRDGNLSVIHAASWTERQDGVNEVPLEEFLQPALAVGIYRPNFIDGAVLSDAVLEYKGRLFDWNFDHNDESKLYCTELLHVILKRLAPEITLKTTHVTLLGKEIIPLDAVSRSEDFEEILVVAPRSSGRQIALAE